MECYVWFRNVGVLVCSGYCPVPNCRYLDWGPKRRREKGGIPGSTFAFATFGRRHNWLSAMHLDLVLLQVCSCSLITVLAPASPR